MVSTECMFIVTLTYTVPLAVIDQHLDAHASWIEAGYQQGVFFASGRLVPRTGGVILAHNLTRNELDERLSHDPFRVNNLAQSEVTEVQPTRVAHGLEAVLN
jgi:uncharacterized protein YciI